VSGASVTPNKAATRDSKPGMTRILVAEDNRTIALGLRRTLTTEGYDVHIARDGREAIAEARRLAPDLIILDIGLPGIDGSGVLETLRKDGLATPVLVLTARTAEDDTVKGFRLGADDYLTKPFRVRELVARIRAILRRAGAEAEMTRPMPPTSPGTVGFGGVVVDTTRCTVHRDGVPVALRPKEFDLLLALIERHGVVASRGELLRAVWGYDSAVGSRTVDMHMLELRRKLEVDPNSPRHLVTVRTRGYRLEL
jgi:two-component system, OmpR family, alkaline phosphatase synthesis response regulator PhoP